MVIFFGLASNPPIADPNDRFAPVTMVFSSCDFALLSGFSDAWSAGSAVFGGAGDAVASESSDGTVYSSSSPKYSLASSFMASCLP